MAEEKFQGAYQHLSANSTWLGRKEANEVFETGGVLLTIVDHDKKQFYTKQKAADPMGYEVVKAEILAALRRRS
jgi:hypothetical protein